MKLAIVNLTSGGLSGGYRKYLQKIVPLLCANTCVSRVYVFVPPQTEELVGFESSPMLYWPITDSMRGFSWLKSKIQQLSPDIVFIPTARWLNFGQTPVVMMIRNMEPLAFPFGGNPLQEGIKNLLRAYVAKRSCQQASRVIAVSQYIKNFLCKHWKIESSKIGIVYHGAESPSESEVFPVTTYGLVKKDERFIFTAGSVRPARGLEDLIDALGTLHKDALNFKLVIAGAVDPGMGKFKDRLIDRAFNAGIVSQIIWTGSLSAEEMSWCYRHCDAFVMTSRVEACPNIALEAMAHGCICISTESPPMPEIFRDAAVHYLSKDGTALAGVIRSIFSWGNNRRNDASKRAKLRAAQFSWDITAEKTVAELSKTIDNYEGNEARP